MYISSIMQATPHNGSDSALYMEVFRFSWIQLRAQKRENTISVSVEHLQALLDAASARSTSSDNLSEFIPKGVNARGKWPSSIVPFRDLAVAQDTCLRVVHHSGVESEMRFSFR